MTRSTSLRRISSASACIFAMAICRSATLPRDLHQVRIAPWRRGRSGGQLGLEHSLAALHSTSFALVFRDGLDQTAELAIDVVQLTPLEAEIDLPIAAEAVHLSVNSAMHGYRLP